MLVLNVLTVKSDFQCGGEISQCALIAANILRKRKQTSSNKPADGMRSHSIVSVKAEGGLKRQRRYEILILEKS